MKKTLTIICLLLMTIASWGSNTGSCGRNLIWFLNDYSGELTISGTGVMDDFSFNTVPWYANRDRIKTVNIGDEVTSIGEWAFYSCIGLSTIDIPNSVTKIGAFAFDYCMGLSGTLNIPASVTSIGRFAFYGCSGITSLSLPSSTTSIENGAFAECYGLTSITCMATEMPTTDANAFADTNMGNVTLSVPEASVEAYRATSPWSSCGTIKAIGSPSSSPTVNAADSQETIEFGHGKVTLHNLRLNSTVGIYTEHGELIQTVRVNDPSITLQLPRQRTYLIKTSSKTFKVQ